MHRPWYALPWLDNTTRGGGVLIAIKKSIPFREHSISHKIEAVAVELFISPKTFLHCVYNPPGSSDFYHHEINNFLYSLPVEHDITLLGDFNTPDVNWSSLTGTSPFSVSLCNCLFTNNLIQLVSEPTHVRGNILDLCITNTPYRLSNLDLCITNTPYRLSNLDLCITNTPYRLSNLDLCITNTPYRLSNLDLCITNTPYRLSILAVDQSMCSSQSDHHLLTLNILSTITHKQVTESPLRKSLLNYSKADIPSIEEYLLNSSIVESTPHIKDVNTVWLLIKREILNACYKFTPTVKIPTNPSPKWFDSQIRHQINQIRTLRRRTTKTPSPGNMSRLCKMELELRSSIQSAKSDFISQILSAFHEQPRKLFSYFKDLSKSKLFRNSSFTTTFQSMTMGR